MSQSYVRRCKVCGSDKVATYVTKGKRRYRNYCPACWLAVNNRRRISRRAAVVPEGYEQISNPKLLPPENTIRVVINIRRHIVSIYTGRLRKTWSFDALKRLNTGRKLKDAYVGMGYSVVKVNGGNLTLEKGMDDERTG